MIVAQSDIEFVRKGRRTQMVLPRHALARCPVHEGRVYRLQSKPFERGQMSITVVSVGEAVLGEMTEVDARRQGFGAASGARRAWVRQYGLEGDDQPVWVVMFVRGNHSKFMAQAHPRLLVRRSGSTRGEYVSEPHLAMAREPEAIPAALQEKYTAHAHERDAARDFQPVHGRAARIQREIVELRSELRAAGVSDAQMRRELQRLERPLARIRERLASAA